MKTKKTLSGTVFTLGDDRLLIEDFTYDGNGPDAFFYIGTEGELITRTTNGNEIIFFLRTSDWHDLLLQDRRVPEGLFWRTHSRGNITTTGTLG